MEKAVKLVELEKLVDNFTNAQVAICADFRGLSVAKMTNLRRELRKVGANGKVVRNTLARIAVAKVEGGRGAKQSEVDRFLATINGPTLVITSDSDPIAPTKVLAGFAKSNELFRVKGCWLDGAYVDAAGVDSLSKMPGRNETFAMLLNLISTPATQLVRVLSEPAGQVVRSIEAYRKKLGGDSAAA